MAPKTQATHHASELVPINDGSTKQKKAKAGKKSSKQRKKAKGSDTDLQSDEMNKTTALTEKQGNEVQLSASEAGTELQSSREQTAITEFSLFPKLPLELRTKIWGFAAPEPCIVIQAQSFHSTVGYRYIREGGKVPAVLHACSESRAEFLDTSNEHGDDVANGDLARRRREHPVYKLSFVGRSKRTSRPVFFSASYDGLWGKSLGDCSRYHNDGIGYNHGFHGTDSLDVAKDLEHLVWRGTFNLKTIMGKFPSLKSFVFLLCSRNYYARPSALINMAPEVNGEIDDTSFTLQERNSVDIADSRRAIRQMLDDFKRESPDKKAPIVKFRFHSQFLENEGIQLPTRPTDPLRDLDEDTDSE